MNHSATQCRVRLRKGGHSQPLGSQQQNVGVGCLSYSFGQSYYHHTAEKLPWVAVRLRQNLRFIWYTCTQGVNTDWKKTHPLQHISLADAQPQSILQQGPKGRQPQPDMQTTGFTLANAPWIGIFLYGGGGQKLCSLPVAFKHLQKDLTKEQEMFQVWRVGSGQLTAGGTLGLCRAPPCCVPAGPTAAVGCCEWLQAAPVPLHHWLVNHMAWSDRGTNLTAALSSGNQPFTCLAAASDFGAMGNSSLHPCDTGTIRVWILPLSIAANLI